MKKETRSKNDKNQVIWEDFVFKNGVKKKFQAAASVYMKKKTKDLLR